MRKSAFDPCIPTKAAKVPDRPEWLHEIKHDGYRLIVQREGKCVRLFTRNGHDWSHRYPLIGGAGAAQPQLLALIDGQGVLLGFDGISDFNVTPARRRVLCLRYADERRRGPSQAAAVDGIKVKNPNIQPSRMLDQF